MPDPGSVRRRPADVILVGMLEAELHSWLRAAGHAPRASRTLEAATAALGAATTELVIADGAPGGLDAADVCSELRRSPYLGDAWVLAITSKGRMSDAALRAGADDFLHRPFSRGELLARVRAGLKAARQRADDDLMRALMVNVPGAIYRSAWHDGHRLELISDEIERISGYPPGNFVASDRRTIISIIHPDDRQAVLEAVASATDDHRPFVLEYRIARADGEVRWVLDRGQPVPGPGGRLWMDGAIFDITDRREAEEALRRHEIEQARSEELRASRARIVEAADAARRRIERDLHDGAQQRLVLASLLLRRAEARAGGTPAEALVAEASDQLREGLAELRDLAHGIHPAVLSDRGLAPALQALVARSPVPVDLRTPHGRAPAAVETAIYFTVAEALTNVAKYSQAGHATVTVDFDGDVLVAEVRDDGIGGASTDAGSGLRGLADRLDAVGGTLVVDSPPGAGTIIRAAVPCAEPAARPPVTRP